MNPRKQRPDSNQASLTAEQTERLMEACRVQGYFHAALWAEKELGLKTTTASLCRWYRKQSGEQTRGALRKAVEASAAFDADLDSRNMDARAKNALSAAFWDAMHDGNAAQIQAFGKLMLDFAKSDQNASRLELETRRVSELEGANKLAREKFEEMKARWNATQATLANLNKTGALSEEARLEIEKAMGVL